MPQLLLKYTYLTPLVKQLHASSVTKRQFTADSNFLSSCLFDCGSPHSRSVNSRVSQLRFFRSTPCVQCWLASPAIHYQEFNTSTSAIEFQTVAPGSRLVDCSIRSSITPSKEILATYQTTNAESSSCWSRDSSKISQWVLVS